MIMGVIGVCFLGKQKILAQIYSVDRQVAIFQIAVLECEAVFPSLCPALVVEVNIRSLFKFFVDLLWLLVSLEPHHVLGMKSPGLFLERYCCKILGARAFHVVKNVE